MIRAIIFDCFGVLVGKGFDETYRSAEGNPDADREFIQDILGAANLGLMTRREMHGQIAQKLNISTKQWQQIVAEIETSNQTVLGHVRKLKTDYKVAILSNANVGTLQRKLTQDELALFDEIVVSAEVGMIKPDPAIYRLTAERLGVQPDNCVFIDDNSGFCKAAQQTGMQAIHYRHFDQYIADLEAILNHM